MLWEVWARHFNFALSKSCGGTALSFLLAVLHRMALSIACSLITRRTVSIKKVCQLLWFGEFVPTGCHIPIGWEIAIVNAIPRVGRFAIVTATLLSAFSFSIGCAKIRVMHIFRPNRIHFYTLYQINM